MCSAFSGKRGRQCSEPRADAAGRLDQVPLIPPPARLHRQVCRWSPPQRRQHLVQGGEEQLSILRREYQRRALRSVTMAGFGVAALPCYLADPALELRRVTTPLPDTEGSLWLFTHGDLRKVARIRTVLDFIADALSRQRGLIEGTTSQTRRA
jgi:DNA-binding transcriptional LysR family regulator